MWLTGRAVGTSRTDTSITNVTTRWVSLVGTIDAVVTCFTYTWKKSGRGIYALKMVLRIIGFVRTSGTFTEDISVWYSDAFAVTDRTSKCSSLYYTCRTVCTRDRTVVTRIAESTFTLPGYSDSGVTVGTLWTWYRFSGHRWTVITKWAHLKG